MTLLYLSGPMTGYPQFNFPLFHKAAAELRTAGYEILSPAETDLDPEHAMKSKDGIMTAEFKESYGEMLGRDVRMIIDNCDGMILLPNWHKSKGARIELATAVVMKKKMFAHYIPGHDGWFGTLEVIDLLDATVLLRDNL